jgi:hypothetical protein
MTQNKILPTMTNWHKEGDTWSHKNTPRKLSGKQLVAYKATLKLTQEQKEILVGSLLGDGFMVFSRTAKNPPYGFCLAQTWYAADHVEYVFQVYC